MLPADRPRRAALDRPYCRLDGAYVATGHSVWDMLNAPATGEAMAELIAEGGARSIDISAFDPARLPALGRDPVRR